jgi:hypothetical protein
MDTALASRLPLAANEASSAHVAHDRNARHAPDPLWCTARTKPCLVCYPSASETPYKPFRSAPPADPSEGGRGIQVPDTAKDETPVVAPFLKCSLVVKMCFKYKGIEHFFAIYFCFFSARAHPAASTMLGQAKCSIVYLCPLPP